jgi:hypothetical protein
MGPDRCQSPLVRRPEKTKSLLAFRESMTIDRVCRGVLSVLRRSTPPGLASKDIPA